MYQPLRSFVFGLLLLSAVILNGVIPAFVLANQPELPHSNLGMHTKLKAEIQGKTYDLEVARTPAQAEQGLMHRKSLAPNTGMLFPFSEPKRVAFWMKNTYIPLDMLFLRNQTVVDVVHQAQPCKQEPCKIYSPNISVDAVIELPGGTAQAYHIRSGTPVSFMEKRAF